MLGWDVIVYKETCNKESGENKKTQLARWDTSISGLDWIDGLVKDGKAVDLGGNGYPQSYSIAANILLPILTSRLPSNSSPPVIGEDYVLPRGWSGQVELDREKILECSDDEKLIIEAWDQS